MSPAGLNRDKGRVDGGSDGRARTPGQPERKGEEGPVRLHQ